MNMWWVHILTTNQAQNMQHTWERLFRRSWILLCACNLFSPLMFCGWQWANPDATNKQWPVTNTCFQHQSMSYCPFKFNCHLMLTTFLSTNPLCIHRIILSYESLNGSTCLQHNNLPKGQDATQLWSFEALPPSMRVVLATLSNSRCVSCLALSLELHHCPPGWPGVTLPHPPPRRPPPLLTTISPHARREEGGRRQWAHWNAYTEMEAVCRKAKENSMV